MRRQIQRRPIRVPRKEFIREKEQASTRAMRIQDFVAIFSSLSGLMVALLWIAGRYYTAAYLEAMNIPFSQVNYSIWEYAGAAGPPLFFLLLGKTFLPLTIFVTAMGSAFLVTFIFQAVFPRLQLVAAMNTMTTQIIKLPRGFRNLLTIALFLYIIYFLTQVAIEFSQTGSRAGQQTVFTQSYAVEVYAKESIPLGTSPLASRERTAFNHYSGLRLLTHNNGKYYLFREIDVSTCKPKDVFIIADKEDIYFVVKDIAPIHITCVPEKSDP